jgi:Ca-activated chloride channel homolog
MSFNLRRVGRLATAVAVVAGAVGPGVHLRSQQHDGQVQVVKFDNIRVPVTVVSGRGRFELGLKKEDFQLFEDGVVQEISTSALQESGLTVVLLIDVSGSMGSRLPEAKQAAVTFVRQVGPSDLVKVVQFDQKATTLIDFSSDKRQLEAAIARATIGGATALHNAIWGAIAALNTRKDEDDAQQRHRAIVVLSDGNDTASALTADEVLNRARSVDALIYSLSLDRQNGAPSTDSVSAVFLGQLATQSGGQLLFPEVVDLERAYRQLADELRHQYVLSYISSNTSATPRWRSIRVQVKNKKGLRIRHRLGYYVGSNGDAQ